MPELKDTLGQRGARYGNYQAQAAIEENILSAMQVEITGDMQNVRTRPGWARLAPDQRGALRMIAHKAARILNGDPDYSDSWHDIAGYASLVDRRLKAEGK